MSASRDAKYSNCVNTYVTVFSVWLDWTHSSTQTGWHTFRGAPYPIMDFFTFKHVKKNEQCLLQLEHLGVWEENNPLKSSVYNFCQLSSDSAQIYVAALPLSCYKQNCV